MLMTLFGDSVYDDAAREPCCRVWTAHADNTSRRKLSAGGDFGYKYAGNQSLPRYRRLVTDRGLKYSRRSRTRSRYRRPNRHGSSHHRFGASTPMMRRLLRIVYFTTTGAFSRYESPPHLGIRRRLMIDEASSAITNAPGIRKAANKSPSCHA